MNDAFRNLADVANLEVMQRRALIEHHRELCEKRKWNPDLLPSEETRLAELEEIALLVRVAAETPSVQDAYRAAWQAKEAQAA